MYPIFLTSIIEKPMNDSDLILVSATCFPKELSKGCRDATKENRDFFFKSITPTPSSKSECLSACQSVDDAIGCSYGDLSSNTGVHRIKFRVCGWYGVESGVVQGGGNTAYNCWVFNVCDEAGMDSTISFSAYKNIKD